MSEENLRRVKLRRATNKFRPRNTVKKLFHVYCKERDNYSLILRRYEVCELVIYKSNDIVVNGKFAECKLKWSFVTEYKSVES